jgi:LysR family cyn operon transcriptional activator
MEIRQLQYFVKAAETMNFTEAASAVFITQSTLSQQIKQLEDELGMLLFDRIGRHVRITEAGHIFLTHARKILKANRPLPSSITPPPANSTWAFPMPLPHCYYPPWPRFPISIPASKFL